MKNIFMVIAFAFVGITYAQYGSNVQKKQTKSTANLKTLIVSPEIVPCSYNSEIQCLKIKSIGNSDYETVEDIENFEYDLGYTYTIQVQPILKTPPIKINESIYRYIWVRTLNKKEFVTEEVAQNTAAVLVKDSYRSTTYSNGKVIGQTKINTDSELDKKWYLRKMIETDDSSFVIEDNVMWIEIKTFNDRIDGFGACNKFATVVKSDLNTTFEVSKLTSNYVQCGYKKIEDIFYDLLQQVNRFEIRNGNLILSNQWKFLLAFTSSPNSKEDISRTYTPSTIVKENGVIYAANKTIVDKDENNYIPVVTDSYVTQSNDKNAGNKMTINGNEEDSIQIQIDELHKRQTEILKKKEDDKRKAEQERLQKQKEDEFLRQQEIEKEKNQLEQQQLAEQEEAKEKQLEQEELIKGKQIENTAATLINQPVTKIDDKDRQIAELKKQLEEQKKITEQQKVFSNKQQNITPVSQSQSINTSETRLMKYKDIAKECVNNYYTSLLQVVDNTIDYEYKSEAKKEIIDVFFENEDKIIGNDLQKLGFNQDTYKVGDYLTKCMSVNGNNKEKQVVVSVADLEISDMYKNKNENIYMFVITFDRILKINENIEDEKSKEKVYSDKIIMTLTTINGDDYKISQFTKLINKYDPLKDGYILVKANETTKSNQPSSSAYFICNIQPATAKLIIDDMEIDYANGEKIATTLGFHKIIIKAPKYVDKILQLNVREIGNKNIDVKLESVKGFLTLIAERSEFDGASIEIINTATNNSYNESLPIHNFELEPGTYNVEIFKNGYYNKKYKNITIFPEINTTKTIKKLVSKEKVKAGVKTTIGILNGLFGK